MHCRRVEKPGLIVVLALLALSEPVFAQFYPALATETVEVSDTEAYGRLLGRINQAMRERHAVPLFLRAYEKDALSGPSSEVFVLSPADSFNTLLRNESLFASDESLLPERQALESFSRTSSEVYLKAVRFDGTNQSGWLLNTTVRTTDQDRLLVHVEALESVLTSEADTNVLLNVFRVVAGSGNFTHLVSINAPSADALSRGMDAIGLSTWFLDLQSECEPVISIVESATFREISVAGQQ